jgi:hypothetical protein
MRTIELGVTITDAAITAEATTIFCAPVVRDPRLPDCGREGRYRDLSWANLVHIVAVDLGQCFGEVIG